MLNREVLSWKSRTVKLMLLSARGQEEEERRRSVENIVDGSKHEKKNKNKNKNKKRKELTIVLGSYGLT